MLSALYLTFLLMAASVLSTPVASPYPEKCGSEVSDEVVQEAAAHFQKFKVPAKEGATFTVPVAWNVIYVNDTAQGGLPTVQQVDDYIKILNDNFATTGVTFRLAKRLALKRAEYFNINANAQQQTDMKKLMRYGGVDTLNIYTVGSIVDQYGRALFGYGTFPRSYENAPEDDGVVIDFNTLPYGTKYPSPYNTGKTLVHEVGHWVGLWHTFQGGCGGVGDEVDDTTPESDPPRRECNERLQTCGIAGKYDPVHNHMDYTPHDCRTQFTAGQITRMSDQLSTYRFKA